MDKKYDETPYDIGEEWKRNNGPLIASAEDDAIVVQALKEFLMENNGVGESKAQIDAQAMIYGSREVQEGEKTPVKHLHKIDAIQKEVLACLGMLSP